MAKFTLAVMVDDIEDENMAEGLNTSISAILSCLGLTGTYAIVEQDEEEED